MVPHTDSGKCRRTRLFVLTLGYPRKAVRLLVWRSRQDPRDASYERVSFAPGQRYASKGCYVVQLGSGPRPALLKRSDWVVH